MRTQMFLILLCVGTIPIIFLVNLITNEYPRLDCSYKNISKISIIGYGIMNDSETIMKTMQILDANALEVLNIQTNESKIRIIFREKVEDNILEQLHNELVNKIN